MSEMGPYGRHQVARDLLRKRRFKESLSLARQPSLRNASLAGLQAALTMAIALPVTLLSPYAHLVAFVSIGALVALFGRFAPDKSRLLILLMAVVCQVLTVLIMSFAAWMGAPFVFQLALLAIGCGVFLVVSVCGKFGPPGAVIFVFAGAMSMANNLSAIDVLERTAATGLAAALALAICAASEVFRQRPSEVRPLPSDPDLSAKDLTLMGVRAVLSTGIAAFTSYAIGADHPAWAAAGALAVLQGIRLHINMHRALQRMIGTTIGAVLAWLLLTQNPSAWPLVIALVILQLLTEVVIGTNYALGQVFMTAMALLMTRLAAPQISGPEIAPERVLDTIIGAIVGMVIAVLLSTIEDRRTLAEHDKSSRIPKARK